MKNIQLPQDKFEYIPCDGGCDFVTPIRRQKAGRLRECLNLEVGVNGGYAFTSGYEAFDGQDSPSGASYTVLAADITGSISAGDTVTGATSGATGYVIDLEAEAVIVTQVVGTFLDAEDITVSAAVQATLTADPAIGAASTAALNAEYLNLAADVYRALIAAIPGSGKVRGVCKYNGVLYGWRDNVGATALAIYKSTSSGWSAVSLGFEIAFTSGGTYVPQEGDTITGATSGATAVLTRVVLESGAWTGGDAAGRFIFASQTGTFQSENLDIGANTNMATIAGDSSAITLVPGGRVKTIIENFTGALGTRRIYGADGQNRGFEFDGTVYVPISTGMATDTPEYVYAHKFQLFFSFGPSVQHAAPGTPYIWSVVIGAAEIAMGDNVTGFIRESGSAGDAALVIFCRNSGGVLYGNGIADWNLVPFRDEIGAIANSIQMVAMSIRLDDRGIASLQSTDTFGNFSGATLSTLVNPWLQQRKTTVTDSCIVREKNQYRIYFDDKSALYITFAGSKVLGMTTVLLADKVECMHSVEIAAGKEEIYFGGDDGFVYQMEKGTSHDGEPITYYGMMNYWHCGSPRIEKTFQEAIVDAEGTGYAEFSLGFELGYSSVDIHQPTSEADVADFQDQVNFLSGRWDVAGALWDVGYWDGVSLSPSNFDLCGDAENIALIFYASSDQFSPINFGGVNVRYKMRKVLRGG